MELDLRLRAAWKESGPGRGGAVSVPAIAKDFANYLELYYKYRSRLPGDQVPGLRKVIKRLCATRYEGCI